mgnify:CR=1 FL=1
MRRIPKMHDHGNGKHHHAHHCEPGDSHRQNQQLQQQLNENRSLAERDALTLVANQALRTPPSSFIKTIQVGAGFDVADNLIVQQLLPGDLVISEREGVLFIPAHMAEKVVATAEFIAVRDRFSKDMLRAGRFSNVLTLR